MARDWPPDHGLHQPGTMAQLYARAIRRYGPRRAIVDSRESVTYEELGRRISACAELFRRVGLVRGCALAQLSTNRIDAVAVLVACFACGIRYTPLHPRASRPEHSFVLQDAKVDAIVIDEQAFPGAIEQLRCGIGRTDAVFSFEAAAHARHLGAKLRAPAPQLFTIDAQPEDIATIFYTGGTTGKGKGAVHRQRSLIANTLIELAEFEWPAETRFLAVTPISHAIIAFILPVLLRGGTLFLRDEFAPEQYLRDVQRHAITATFLVPTMIGALLEDAVSSNADTSSLQMIVYGAAPIAPRRLQQALARFGPVFVQLYGQTEAPNVISVLRKADHQSDRPERLGSCGVPVTGLDVRLLDESDREVSTGQVGEICVRGPLVMEGYWSRPEETEATLRAGWLHTGDLARADAEGYLTIVDRKKDLVISGGFNIYPKEIENVLATHEAVSQVAIIGIPDPKWGEALKAFIVLRAGSSASAEELIDLVRREKGSMYAPKSVEFMEALPVTSLGKPDKKQLRASYWQGQARQVH